MLHPTIVFYSMLMDNKDFLNRDDDFDPGNPPPFKIADIRAAVPNHCLVKNPWRSLSYVFRDVFVILSLAAAALYFNSWAVWPLYWAAQGIMFWAIFLLAHDCGHGSFSDIPLLNNLVGHLLHSSILVPYHGWRISHRIHHQNHGNVEKDESWIPMPENIYKNLSLRARIIRYTMPFILFAFPVYLWTRTPDKEGSHFNPYSNLFAPEERRAVLTSTLCWTLMVLLLLYSCFVFGPFQVFKLYGVPYLIFVMWMDFVTYLNHHGHEQKLPWYRGKEWSYLRGALTTCDRDYGWINNIQHDVGTHVIHHLFPQIPHYHLVEATKAAKPVLGKYYREPKKPGLFPFHLIRTLVKSIREDRFVSDDGEVVYYQTDPNLYKSDKNKVC